MRGQSGGPLAADGEDRLAKRRSSTLTVSGAAGIGTSVNALFGFSAFLILSILTAVMLLIEREQQQAIDNVMRSNSQLARAFEEHAVHALAEATRLAKGIRAQYLREGKKMDLPRYFEANLAGRQVERSAAVIDETGAIVASSAAGFTPSNIADREHFKAHMARDSGELFIGVPVLTRSTGAWSFIVTLRLNKPDGAFGGVVGIAMDPLYFSDFYRRVNLGPQSAINLTGVDGIVRARAGDSVQAAGQDIRGGEIFRQMEKSPAGSYIAQARVDSVRRIQSYRRLADYPLVISVGVAEDVALAAHLAHRSNYIAAALLMTLLILGMTAWIDRAIRRQRDLAILLHKRGDQLLEAQQLAGMVSLEWLVDTDRIIWSRSPAFLLGPELATGYPVFSAMLHPADRERWLADRARGLQSSGEMRYLDFRIIRTDGAERSIRSAQRRMADAPDGSRRMSVTMIDITGQLPAAAAQSNPPDIRH